VPSGSAVGMSKMTLPSWIVPCRAFMLSFAHRGQVLSLSAYHRQAVHNRRRARPPPGRPRQRPAGRRSRAVSPSRPATQRGQVRESSTLHAAPLADDRSGDVPAPGARIQTRAISRFSRVPARPGRRT
jgi:hypothetical protein